MSLNGLDTSAVQQAHQFALTEPGGWFLLKYINRDTVDVLGRGSGGVNEAKSAVGQYEEKSPLYGLVQYRRKRVVLKYVPEGTSRLLQVRLTVQFQSILDAFPHDTTFSFTTPSELVDSALGLSTMLQPPVHSGALTPSSSSGRHHRLNEIREDGEETISASQVELITIPVAKPRETSRPRSPVQNDMSGLPASAIKAKALLAKRKEEDAAAAAEAAAIRARIEEEMTVTAFDDAPSIPDSKTDTTIHPLRDENRKTRALHSPKASSEKVPTTMTFPTPPSTRYSLYRHREESAPPPLPTPTSIELPRSPERPPSRALHTRHLSEHESDSISQWNKQVAAYAEIPLPSSKPKKKLAPRPHVESNNRPKTPTSVVNLPPSVRASNRSNVNLTNRPDSRQSTKSAPTRFVPATVVPPMPTTPLPPFYRSPGSRGAPSVVSSAFTESQPVPPEKLRLMRALQLRKRNVLLAQRAASVQSSRPQDTYLEDFHARNRSEPLNQPPKLPSTPTMTNSQVARVSAEHRRDLSSTTASPTSITTASIDRSTIPSSISGEVDKMSSKSFSIDTHSSSTPRANLPQGVSLKVQPGLKVVEDSDSEGEDPVKDSYTPDRSPVEEAFMRLTGASTPPLPETVVEQPTPKAGNMVETQRLSEHEDNKTRLRPSDTHVRKNSKSGLSTSSKDRRRREFGSMQTNTSAEISDAASYDESFMEELRNATVQEAKPISVPRVSETPKMRKLSVDKIREMVRIPTSETIKTLKSLSNEQENQPAAAARSLSAAVAHWPPSSTDGNPAPLSNKPTLGSGISKRIKALEVLTHRESVQNPSPPSPREASGGRSTFSGLMSRASIRSPFQAPNASIDRSPPKKLPETRSMPPPAKTTPPVPQPFVQRPGEATELYVPQHKGETISVTARIIRNQARPPSSFPPHFNDSAVNLHRSPLIVEHERRDSDVSRVSTSRDMSNGSFEPIPTPKSDKRRFSFSSHKSGSTARQPQMDGRASRMSSREKRHAKANSETSSITEDKRSSRASRLMKRMSGIGGRFSQNSLANKDSAPPETIMEYSESVARRESTSESSVLQMIDIGDVNVQFPETLLWKRRYMRIDDQGYLVFSPPSDNMHLRTTNRKFHLGDLRTPKIPDSELEEMAWSICIDLEDGRCIQCACESKQAQRQILKMLRDAHDAYNSLYS